MPRAKKGERFGGRTKGTPNKATVERQLIAAREAEARVAEAHASGRRLGKDVLDEFMHLFAGMAATYQPLPTGMPIPQGRQPDEAQFEKYARLAVHCATKLAPYQSPTFQAIMVAPPPPDPGASGQRKRFTLTIFEGPRPAAQLINGPAAKNGRDAA
jgi:hypothetical protein